MEALGKERTKQILAVFGGPPGRPRSSPSLATSP